MRQWNHVELVPGKLHAELFADDLVEAIYGEGLRDGELADRNHQCGLKDFKFTVAPESAVRDFLG